MTRDEAVVLIQQQMAFRTTLSSEIVTNMQAAQVLLEQEPVKPWWLKSSTTLTTTSATQAIPLPVDFLEEIEDRSPVYVPDSVSDTTPKVVLRKDSYDVLRENFQDGSTGTTLTGSPQAYALEGTNIELFPIPDASTYDITFPYYAKDTVLSSNVENGWLKYAPFLLMGKAGQMIATAVRDPTAGAAFAKWEAEGRAVLTNKAIAREMAGMDMQVGGPH